MSMMYCLRLATPEELNTLVNEPDMVEEWLFDTEETPADAELGKSWHGIHFLLTGSEYEGEKPYCYLLSESQEIGEDLGYGPARILTSEQANEFSACLENIDEADFKSRYDRHKQDMDKKDIYPGGWQSGNDSENFDFLFSNLTTLKEFLKKASDSKYGAVLWLE